MSDLDQNHSPAEERRKPTLLQVAASVIAAFFGVQSEANRRRDFAHGQPHQYIIIGIVSTAIFVVAVWALVQLVLWLALPAGTEL